jgi:hypothetical protein
MHGGVPSRVEKGVVQRRLLRCEAKNVSRKKILGKGFRNIAAEREESRMQE